MAQRDTHFFLIIPFSLVNPTGNNATRFRRDKQKGLTVNTVNLMIKH
ncbi:MAG: hypothetical protein WCP01_08240 [Methylococcaceae bacterium]